MGLAVRSLRRHPADVVGSHVARPAAGGHLSVEAGPELGVGGLVDGPRDTLELAPGPCRVGVSARGRSEARAREHTFPDDDLDLDEDQPLEHCPMCAAAQGWVGLGRLVYASSSAQTSQWLDDLGLPPSPVLSLPVQQVAPGVDVDGPSGELAALVHDLHRRRHETSEP